MKRKGKATMLVLAGLAVLGAAGAVVLMPRLRAGAGEVLHYQTAVVGRGPLAVQVTASGTLSPLVTVQVGSQVSGRIKELLADFNSTVSRGQLIARIDPQLFESGVARAKADVAAARASVRRTEARLAEVARRHARTAALAEKKLVAQADADATEAELRSAEAETAVARAALDQAQAALTQAQTNLAYANIYSPIDGVVISRTIDVGQTVAASFQAPTLFTIAEDLRRMEVHTSVAESDIGRLEPGMPVTFTVDAYPTEHFQGVIKQVRYAPTTVQNVVTYDAVISVDNDELKLRPGMTADVRFIVEQRDDVLLLPNAALRFRLPGDAAAGTPGGPPPSIRPGGAPVAGSRLPGAFPHGARGAFAGGPPGGREGAALQGGTVGGAAGGAAGEQAGGYGAPGMGPAGAAAAPTGGPMGRAGEPSHGFRPRVVYLLGPDGRPHPVQVRIGISDGRHTELVEGLAEGDQVVVGLPGQGPEEKKPGGRMRPPRFL